MKGNLARLTCMIVTAAFVVAALPPPAAEAWKMKTHDYSANLILDEIAANGGQLEIPPYGKFPVPAEYLAAIGSYPRAYRAGAIGPDGYPDMYVGQAFVHPTKLNGSGTYTTEWLQQLWDSVQAMPPGPAKQEGLAFALGYLTHAAGDTFGHDYINQLSGGVFPAISEAAQDAEKMRIIARHNITEAYIDSKIPGKYANTNSEYFVIQAPETFVRDRMLTNGGIANGSNLLFSSFSEQPLHLKNFYDTRTRVINEIASLTHSIDAAPWYDVRIPFWKAKRSYCYAWRDDIDAGITAWVSTNQVVAQRLLKGEYTEAKQALTGWAINNYLSMSGFPDVVGDIISKIGNIADWIAGLLPQSLRDAWTQFKENVIYDTITRKAFNMTYEELMSLMKDPGTWLDNGSRFRGAQLFPAGIRAKMDADMGNFPQDLTTASSCTFSQFHNTVTMGKLVMIGPAGVNALANKAGYPGAVVSGGSLMLGFLQSLDGSKSWEDGRTVGKNTWECRPNPLFAHKEIWAAIFRDPQTEILNGSFEEWKADKVPMYWYRVPYAPLATGPRTDWKTSGATGVGIDFATDSEVWTEVVVTAGTEYRASVNAVTDRVPAKVQVALEFRDAADNTLSQMITSGDAAGIDGSSMKAVSATGKAPAGSTNARIHLKLLAGPRADGAPGGSSVVFDDAKIEAVSGAIDDNKDDNKDGDKSGDKNDVQKQGLTLLSIEGATRIDTAIKASQAAFTTAETVVIATAYNFPDALGGASLAGALNAPLLLTNTHVLPGQVEAEIRRLGAKRVIVLGSPVAVSSEVGTKLASLVGGWGNFKRLGGTDRYGTAYLVAGETINAIGADKFDGTIFVATGENFPDALAASPIAAAKKRPILLTRGYALPNIVKNNLGAMKVKKAIILGSSRAVDNTVEQAIAGQGVATSRVEGPTRYQTAIAAARSGVAEGLKWNGLALATGSNYPDALTGGVMCGRFGSVMLLTDPNTLTPDVRNEIGANKSTIQRLHFLGSTAAVSQGVRSAVAGALQ